MSGSGARPTESVPELSVIVITYGAAEMSLRCLASIAREAPEPLCEVIVVDNGSADGLAAAIAAAHPRFRVIPQRANLGFAAAGNLAADIARGKYLLFLNPDTLIPEGAVARLLRFAEGRLGAGVWGGRTIYGDGSLNPTSCRRRPSLWSLYCSALALDTRFPNSALFAAMNYGGWARDSERQVDIVCGCFLLVERALWDRLAGFSPAFFMYGEDEDFCLRAYRLGYRPVFTPDAEIVHFGSGTEPSQARKLRQIFAARALLIRIHFVPLTRPLAILALALRPCFGRLLARRAFRGVWAQVWAGRRLWLRGRFG